MTFGESLEMLLQENNINRTELARRMGMHPSSIVYYIKGKRFPTKNTLANMAKVLNADAKTLTLWEKARRENKKQIEKRKEIRKWHTNL